MQRKASANDNIDFPMKGLGFNYETAHTSSRAQPRGTTSSLSTTQQAYAEYNHVSPDDLVSSPRRQKAGEVNVFVSTIDEQPED
jgi:hypothetical protein